MAPVTRTWTASAAALLLVMAASAVNARVTISRALVTEQVTQNIEVGPGRFVAVPLPGGNAGDRYRVEVDVRNNVYRDISAFVVDEANLQRFQRRERFQGHGHQKTVTPFVIESQAASAARHYLVLDNSYALVVKKSASVTIRLATAMPADLSNQLEDGISALYAALKRVFRFQDFNIMVAPCGQVNAFSAQATGDITLCTETVSKAAGKPGAFAGILLHELGHTLLGLWGLPGADHEDMADEFAVQFLMRTPGGAARVKEFTEFFSGGNPWLEARNIIRVGDRHTISTQRIRNLQGWAQDGVRLVQRWNRLIYPHMTDEALRSIAVRPSEHDDRELAEAELGRRGIK